MHNDAAQPNQQQDDIGPLHFRVKPLRPWLTRLNTAMIEKHLAPGETAAKLARSVVAMANISSARQLMNARGGRGTGSQIRLRHSDEPSHLWNDPDYSCLTAQWLRTHGAPFETLGD